MLHRSHSYPTRSAESFLEHLLFFDIETTGFSHTYDTVALISLGRQQDGLFILDQYLAEQKDEETSILISTIKAIQDAPLTVTYNGNQFDIPFLNSRLKKAQMGWLIDKSRSLDLYRLLGKGKLKSNESGSGFARTDTLSGKQWAQLYKDMLHTGDTSAQEDLLLHNAEDVYAMYHLLTAREELLQAAGQRIYTHDHIKTLQQVVVGKDHLRILFHSPQGEDVLELPLIPYHQFKVYAHPQFDALSAEQKRQCFLVEDDQVHLDRLHTLIHQLYNK